MKDRGSESRCADTVPGAARFKISHKDLLFLAVMRDLEIHIPNSNFICSSHILLLVSAGSGCKSSSSGFSLSSLNNSDKRSPTCTST